MPRYKLPTGEGVQTKPLVFGESAFDSDRLDDFEYAMGHRDASYVPGYHEQRVENEMRVKDGKPPIPMPRLQWVRIKRPNAADYVAETDEGMVEWIRLGYKAMGTSDLERYGYGWPPAAGSGPTPDGLICRGGDLALFFIDEERADRNRRAQAQELRDLKSDDLAKTFEPKDPASARGKIESLADERYDEDGKFFLGETSAPEL